MKCECGGDTEVIDVRHGPVNTVSRRRVCLACGHRMTTWESTRRPIFSAHEKRHAPRNDQKRAWWRSLTLDQRRAVKQRERLRAAARREAQETGEPVEQIFARWGCE